MTPETYKLLHVLGVLLMFLGLGGVLATGGREGAKASRVYLLLHGLGALASLVAGIGFAHRSGMGFPTWVIAKIAAWLVLGLMPLLVSRGILPRAIALVLVLGLGAFGAWVGLVQPKPF